MTRHEDRIVHLSGYVADVIRKSQIDIKVGDSIVIDGVERQVISSTWYADKAWDEYEDENGDLVSVMVDCPGSWIAEMTVEETPVQK